MLARFSPNAIRSRPRLFIALIAIGLLFAAIPPTVAAQGMTGALFTGIGFVDDHSVEDGVVVEAWIRGVPVAATEIFNQGFILHVEEPPGESYDGEIVRFKFRGLETDTTADWVEGSETYINIHAYTGQQGDGGNETAYPDPDGGNETAAPGPDDINAILELHARLLELERERFEWTAELEHQVEIEIANVKSHWEGAIADLKAEVEREIQQVTRDYEYESRQILLGNRRDGSLRSLKAELDAIIEEKWAWFEEESWQKRQYLRDDIAEIERAKAFELINLDRRISQVESELQERLEKTGISYEDFLETGGIEKPVIDVAPRPSPTPEDVKDLPPPTPEVPRPDDSGSNRGFFFNSISADPNSLNRKLDPTALAVIGILITLAATGVQLLKGN